MPTTTQLPPATKAKTTTVLANEYHDKTFAKRLKNFRQQYIHKRQITASEMLNIAQSSLSYMESGKSPIKIEFLSLLIEKFDLNQEWLFTGTGNPTSKKTPKPAASLDLKNLNEELALLKKQIQIMELNQDHLLKIVSNLEKKLAGR